MGARSPSGPKKRRERGDDGIYWDKINKCYVGTISLGNRQQWKAASASCARQDQDRGQGQTERAARRAQRRHRDTGDLHRPAVCHGLARLTGAGPAHRGHLPGPGREVDLSGDRRDEAEGLQSHRRRPLLPGRRQGAQQGVAREDQEHAHQVDPARPEVRPHRPERRRARRPAARAAGPSVAGHERGTGRQGAQGRERPGRRATSRWSR